ncbi:7319_t:CDS:2 [Funneliformis caledonium]|uniref:7319_t:CDS:1 n=1 Tax=Funneliformis caledonium TaxID=1117310 RepID=A0A9N8W3G2_9GLOM|nr:7319_t:CDS:2 [Funneliformis caledonium]
MYYNEITFNDPNTDDDLEIITEEPIEIEETLNLSNSRFLQVTENSGRANNNELENEPFDLEAFYQEEDYNPTELATMFLN